MGDGDPALSQDGIVAQPIQQGYHPNVVVSGDQNVITLGHQGAAIQQTLPQKLAKHSIWYWIVHFVLGLAAAAVVELLFIWLKAKP